MTINDKNSILFAFIYLNFPLDNLIGKTNFNSINKKVIFHRLKFLLVRMNKRDGKQ